MKNLIPSIFILLLIITPLIVAEEPVKDSSFLGLSQEEIRDIIIVWGIGIMFFIIMLEISSVIVGGGVKSFIFALVITGVVAITGVFKKGSFIFLSLKNLFSLFSGITTTIIIIAIIILLIVFGRLRKYIIKTSRIEEAEMAAARSKTVEELEKKKLEEFK